LIERLVPDGIVVVATREDLVEVDLPREEQRSLGRAVEKRRREFVTGRACARQALRELGSAPVAIPSGERGEPLWPRGVVGSLTHCHGYRACAVARADAVRSVGIDAEVHEPLPDGVLDQVAFGRERQAVTERSTGVHLDRLLFSAKEAVYKAWYPLARRWLGFEDAELSIDVRGGTFRARLLVPGPAVDGRPLTGFDGRWTVEDGILATAVVVNAPPVSAPAAVPRPGTP
jgi:4'-phosphopantetheinyl transferase EntD